MAQETCFAFLQMLETISVKHDLNVSTNIDHVVIDDKVETIHNLTIVQLTPGWLDTDIHLVLDPWLASEQGRWAVNKSVAKLFIHRFNDQRASRPMAAITGRFLSKDYTYYMLKWG